MTQNIEQSKDTDTSSPRGNYDAVSKILIQENPQDWIRFGLGIPDAHFLQILDTEQHTVKSNRADSFLLAKVNGKESVIHFEIQTRDSTDNPMPQRMAGYIGRCIESYGLPIYSHVIYLHPNAGRNDPGRYIQELEDYTIEIRYKVIRLCELDGQYILDAKMKGLIPFAPLMKSKADASSEDWLRQCVKVARTVTQNVQHQADFLTNLGILSGIILDYEIIRDIILEETMQESTVIQHFIQQGMAQGIEQGVRDATIEAILEVLEVHFAFDSVQSFKPILETIEDIQQLKYLLREAARANSLDEFKLMLPE